MPDKQQIEKAINDGWTFVVKYNKDGYTISAINKDNQPTLDFAGKDLDSLVDQLLKAIDVGRLIV